MSYEKAIHAKAIELGKLAVEMTTAAGSGHPSSSLSLAHLVTVLMYDQMRWDPGDPWNETSDRLVLSEGHAVPIVYAAYSDLGGAIGKSPDDARPMTREDALSLRAIESTLDGHPNPQLGFPFFDAATGSLGQGLSAAAGLGLAARLKGTDRNVYCLIGDGESREGQIYEALDFIVDYALVNVIPIFNCNSLAQSDWVSPQQSPDTLARKLEAFGCIVRMIDGHDPREIRKALDELPVVRNGHRPLAIVARTIKAWGAPSEQGMGKHGTPVKPDKMSRVFDELDQMAEELVGDEEPDFKLPQLKKPAVSGSEERGFTSRSGLPSFEDALVQLGFDQVVSGGKPFATRKAYGVALCMLGAADPRVVALDGDVKNSTYAEWFFQRFPERAVECRIAEQNMISVALGMATSDLIPFCSTFGKFFERAYDQIEMAVISGANIKLTGSHAGVTLAADGPSQMALSDVAFFRSLAHVHDYNGNTAVHYFFPSDAVSCYRITALMAEIRGCCYQRTVRADLPLLYDPGDTDFKAGGYRILREGSDLVLVSAGYMVHEALGLAERLVSEGKQATVIDAYSLPLDTAGLLDIATQSGRRIVTIEDNYTGGLDAELSIAITEADAGITLHSHVVGNLPKSGREPSDVLDYVGLSLDTIHQMIT